MVLLYELLLLYWVDPSHTHHTPITHPCAHPSHPYHTPITHPSHTHPTSITHPSHPSHTHHTPHTPITHLSHTHHPTITHPSHTLHIPFTHQLLSPTHPTHPTHTTTSPLPLFQFLAETITHCTSLAILITMSISACIKLRIYLFSELLSKMPQCSLRPCRRRGG